MYERTTAAGGSAWVAHVFWTESGRRRQLKRSFRSKREAKAALAELLQAHETDTFVEPTKTTLRAYAAVWLDGLEVQGRKASTLSGYRGALDRYVLPTLGDTPLQDLKASQLDALYGKLRRSGGIGGRELSLTTVHHAHAVINKMLNDAERKGLVLRNVARLADPPSLASARARSPELRVWTPAELSRFLSLIEGHPHEPMFRLLALTGMRRSEVVGLRWSDVDEVGCTVSVMQAVTIIDGLERVDVPKTRRSRRMIDIDPVTLGLLATHREAQRVQLARVRRTTPIGDRVFTNEVGGTFQPNSIGQAFHRLVDQHGLPKIRLHDLRHTHASHLLSAGINIKVVSDRLGHASVSFTLDTYGHVLPGDQAAAAAAAAALVARTI